MNDEDSSRIEQTARLENEAIAAMQTLVEEFGYTAADLESLIESAVNA